MNRAATTRPSRRLLAIEYVLLAIGAALSLWAAVAWLHIWTLQRLPVPEEATSSPAPPVVVAEAAGATGAAGGAGGAARGAWLARLDAPSVRLSTTVLEGSDDDTLLGAAGHIEDTAFPGQPGNIGIAGHRDTVFRPIRNIHVGDPLVLTTTDRVFRYRISNTMVVNPSDVQVLDPTEQPALTLVTCYPFAFVGHAPRRFIVRAELVGEDTRPPRD